jgi:hypothetical protein
MALLRFVVPPRYDILDFEETTKFVVGASLADVQYAVLAKKPIFRRRRRQFV